MYMIVEFVQRVAPLLSKTKWFFVFYTLSCRLDLEVEPLFASMALYDGRVKKKVHLLLDSES